MNGVVYANLYQHINEKDNECCHRRTVPRGFKYYIFQLFFKSLLPDIGHNAVMNINFLLLLDACLQCQPTLDTYLI